MDVRHEYVEQILAALDRPGAVLVQGAVGSGKSTVLATLRQQLSGRRDCLYIPGDPQDTDLPFAALSHLITSPGSAYADLLIHLAEATDPVFLIDDFQLLDTASRRLLLWTLEQGKASAVICCHRVEAHHELVELLAESRTGPITLEPLNAEDIGAMLQQSWDKEPLPWQVLAAARYTDANPLAVATLAQFVKENLLESSDARTWQEHFLLPFEDSHASLRRYLAHLGQAYDPALLAAAQRLAVLGPCSVPQALQLVGSSTLQTLQQLGLVSVSQGSSLVQLANSLLDLSLRIELLEREAVAVFGELIREQLDYPGYQPPAAHVLWWDHAGLEVSEPVRLAAARAALAQGHPQMTHLLLTGCDSVQAHWLRAEGQVLEGNAHRAREQAERALEKSDPAEPLNATAALVCVATGLWPEQAERCAAVSGLEICAAVVHAGMLGDYPRVLQLANTLDAGTDRQMRQNVMVLAATAEALLGRGAAALERLKALGQVAPDASAITQQNVADGRRTVLFLTGNWDALSQLIGDGYELHAVTDRSGFSSELAVLMNQPSGAPLNPIEYGTPSPLGCVQLRELARLVNEGRPDPLSTVTRISALAASHGEQLAVGVRLFFTFWMIRLTELAGKEPEAHLVAELEATAAETSSKLGQVLALYARGHREANPALATLAREQAHKAGMIDWLPALDTDSATERPPVAGQLSKREFQVSRLAAAGERSHDIAEQLQVSVRTVETHLRNTYRKLGITNRHELAAVLSQNAGH